MSPQPQSATTAPEVTKVTLQRCPKCGSTDTFYDIADSEMHCHVCRSRWHATTVSAVHDDVIDLQGAEISPGAADVSNVDNTEEVITFKCPMCHAEISVILSNESTIKCHWCRHELSLADKIQNGIDPDGILPFTITREKAAEIIQDFLSKRKFFAHSTFVKEFSLDSMYPIYLPYFIFDAKCQAHCSGQAAHLVRKYTRGSSKNQTTYYDYDVYNFSRDFELLINDLTIEGNSNYTNHNTAESTQNVINAIMPFDTDKLVAYSAQYLQGGYRFEKRNLNISDIDANTAAQVRDISRYQVMTKTMSFYDHGIKFENNKIDTHGTRFITALLPMWLYSYQQQNGPGGKPLLHYIVVNGRSGEVQGSVPINFGKLFIISFLVEIVGIFLFLLFIIF